MNITREGARRWRDLCLSRLSCHRLVLYFSLVAQQDFTHGSFPLRLLRPSVPSVCVLRQRQRRYPILLTFWRTSVSSIYLPLLVASREGLAVTSSITSTLVRFSDGIRISNLKSHVTRCWSSQSSGEGACSPSLRSRF